MTNRPPRPLNPATLAAQAMGRVDPAHREISPPIHMSSTYERPVDLDYQGAPIYSRADNPTYRLAEELLTRLEGGADGLVFGSGMAAATAVFNGLAPGDHIIAPKIMYWALRNWLTGHAARWGLEMDFVPNSDLAALRAAVRPGQTKLLWLETPANPTWDVDDIAAWADIAHGAGAKLAVDNTVATPMLTRPIEHGADLVMHSATKYLNGHSDVVAGALITAQDDTDWATIRGVRGLGGAVLGPQEAWLLLRGMRTLPLRVERACQNAMAIAQRFADDPRVSAVLYPGLASDPGHAIATKQMTGGYSGMLSLRITGGRDAAVRVASRTHLFKRATSLGGVESLIEHRASMEGPDTPCPDDLLRLSVGIEAIDDLIADLDQALAEK